MSTARKDPVLDITERPDPGPMRRFVDSIIKAFGKEVSLCSITLLADMAGYTVTNAAAGAGTDLPEARSVVHFGDAGIDQARLVVSGKNSAAGSVPVQVYRGATVLGAVTVTGTSTSRAGSDWITFVPTGADEEVGVTVIGNGSDDPVLYRVELQCRTLRKLV